MGSHTDRVQKVIEAFNDHAYDAVGAAMTDDATWTDVPGGTTAKGRDEVVEYLKSWHEGFSNARVTEPTFTSDNGKVAVEFIGRGTQSNEFGPFPNKGGEFELNAVQIYSLDDSGQIKHVDLYYDTMTMLTQLGHMG
jgi:steroid delta-isomerase-like uncharacterized protein